MTKEKYKKSFKYIFYIFCYIFCISQFSCSSTRKSNRIIIASAGKITSIDPAQASTFHALQLLSALGDPLYRISRNGKLEPRLANGKPTISKDRLTISIPIRKGVLFHDGTTFDAYSMAFSLNRFMRIGTLNYLLNEKIESFETPERYLLKIKLKKPSVSLTGLLTSISLTPVSPTSYKLFKDDFLNKKFIGTGPYKLSSFNSQQQKLEPFLGYWGPKPYNNGIDFINLSNSTALFGALKSGEVDVLLSSSIDEDQHFYLHKKAKEGKFKESEGPALEIGYITFLSNMKPLNNKVLRKAVSLSLDRNMITKRVSYGLRRPLRSLIPPYLQNQSIVLWPKYNPQKSKDLLLKSGYCDQKRLDVTLTYRSNVPADKILALTWKALIEKDMSNCLRLILNGVESTTVYKQLGKGAFQAVILDWRGAYPDPEAYLSPLLSCNKSNGPICDEGEASISGSFWTAPNLDKEIKESDQLIGIERIKKINKIHEAAVEGSAYLPVWLVKPRVWTQLHLAKPEFDGSGQLLLNRLRVRSQ